jgi:hypothetical protein
MDTWWVPDSFRPPPRCRPARSAPPRRSRPPCSGPWIQPVKKLVNSYQDGHGRKGPCFCQRINAQKCLKCQKIQKIHIPSLGSFLSKEPNFSLRKSAILNDFVILKKVSKKQGPIWHFASLHVINLLNARLTQPAVPYKHCSSTVSSAYVLYWP